MDQAKIQFIMDNVQYFNWTAWITATATLLLAVLTFIYVRLMKKILASQSDPCVILTVVHDEDRPTIIQLVAKNVGTGLAKGIRFEFSRPIPAKAWGISADEAREATEMKEGPLIDGIPALGPGECRKIDWGQYGGLVANLGNEPVIATCKFKKNGKDMTPILCPLDIASFVGTVAIQSPQAKAAKELEKISNSIQHLASRHYKLKIEVVSLPPDQRDEESQ